MFGNPIGTNFQLPVILILKHTKTVVYTNSMFVCITMYSIVLTLVKDLPHCSPSIHLSTSTSLYLPTYSLPQPVFISLLILYLNQSLSPYLFSTSTSYYLPTYSLPQPTFISLPILYLNQPLSPYLFPTSTSLYLPTYFLPQPAFISLPILYLNQSLSPYLFTPQPAFISLPTYSLPQPVFISLPIHSSTSLYLPTYSLPQPVFISLPILYLNQPLSPYLFLTGSSSPLPHTLPCILS